MLLQTTIHNQLTYGKSDSDLWAADYKPILERE